MVAAPTYNDRDRAHLIAIGISPDCYLSPPVEDVIHSDARGDTVREVLVCGVFFMFFGDPICSMYGIFTYIWLTFVVNVGKYSSPIRRIWGWFLCPGWVFMHLLSERSLRLINPANRKSVGKALFNPGTPSNRFFNGWKWLNNHFQLVEIWNHHPIETTNL